MQRGKRVGERTQVDAVFLGEGVAADLVILAVVAAAEGHDVLVGGLEGDAGIGGCTEVMGLDRSAACAPKAGAGSPADPS